MVVWDGFSGGSIYGNFYFLDAQTWLSRYLMSKARLQNEVEWFFLSLGSPTGHCGNVVTEVFLVLSPSIRLVGLWAGNIMGRVKEILMARRMNNTMLQGCGLRETHLIG